MEKSYKVVTVKHPNCNDKFTFKVPENMILSVGDYVLVKTRKHKTAQVAKCITPDFAILGCLLEELYGIKPENLMPVVGVLHPVMYAFEAGEGE